MIVKSGCRCPDHNKEEGGKPNSDHLTGEGIDIKATTGRMKYRIIMQALWEGIHRIGIGKNFVHLGINKDNPQRVIWVY